MILNCVVWPNIKVTQYTELTKVKSPAVLRYTRACTFIHVHNKSTASLSSILTKLTNVKIINVKLFNKI
jgi:hypothetical protein